MTEIALVLLSNGLPKQSDKINLLQNLLFSGYQKKKIINNQDFVKGHNAVGPV